MKTYRFLKRDIRLGIINRSYLLIVAAIFSFVMVQNCSDAIHSLKEIKWMWSNGTVMDYFLFSVQGKAFYRFDPKQSFQLPLLWFVFQIGISYFIAYYAEKDYTDNGVNAILAGRSRSSWWISKIIWCILSVVLYYFVAFISNTLLALYHGATLSLNVSPDFFQAQFGYNMRFVTRGDFILIGVIVPIAVTIAICLVQLLLSFIISPVTSFALICGIYVLSAYYTAWFLPGSFTMWLRSSYFDENGLNPLSGLVIAAFLSISVCVIGREYFVSRDII